MRRTSEIPTAITEMKTQRRRPQHLLVVRGLVVGLLQTFGLKTSGESLQEKVHRLPTTKRRCRFLRESGTFASPRREARPWLPNPS